MLRLFSSVLTVTIYNAKLCFLVTVCVFFTRTLLQHDPQSIRGHIITALYGHVPQKPQLKPPFWVFHHFHSLRFA